MAIESPITSTEGRPRLWRRARGWLYWLVIAALLGANVWYLIRDFFPLPEVRTISLWMRERQYFRAEAACAPTCFAHRIMAKRQSCLPVF